MSTDEINITSTSKIKNKDSYSSSSELLDYHIYRQQQHSLLLIRKVIQKLLHPSNIFLV